MNLATDIRPLIITKNCESKMLIQDIESCQKIQNALVLLKFMVQSEEDIKSNRFESQKNFFNKIEKKLA